MDAVTNVDTAVAMSKMGGLSVLHLEGIYTRYENPQEILDQIISKPIDEVTSFMQKVYTAEPIKEHLISKRVSEIKAKGGICAVSLMPANAKKLAPVAVEAGADIISVASTVTSARHVSKSSHGWFLKNL
ncbi:Inosine-5'-monophosphate dehydrogenase, catalytic domain [Dehalococcoides mccartyi]|uniref:Inosine-5'-monophosphate dehydrogenase, catalytic domain n=1 Tax=Dehalococcoides mccartyi TaxID=61435 RepID=A0A328ELK0_9CHLR|nr:Inosine-5'-monophosphate dehydrogenase, catalytic domain [Dehalococcoides mccartyi]